MQIVHTLAELRQSLKPFHTPAEVPTMGNLHDGHLALVQAAKPLGDVTLATVFVNRLQLHHEDFDSYSRTLKPTVLLKAAGCDIVLRRVGGRLHRGDEVAVLRKFAWLYWQEGLPAAHGDSPHGGSSPCRWSWALIPAVPMGGWRCHRAMAT
jgi:hypothetical protein